MYKAGRINIGGTKYWLRQYQCEMDGDYWTAFGPVGFKPFSGESHRGLLDEEEIIQIIRDAPKRRLRQVRDALNKCKDPELVEKVGKLLDV